jgi:hypothetical protein
LVEPGETTAGAGESVATDPSNGDGLVAGALATTGVTAPVESDATPAGTVSDGVMAGRPVPTVGPTGDSAPTAGRADETEPVTDPTTGEMALVSAPTADETAPVAGPITDPTVLTTGAVISATVVTSGAAT